MFTFLFNSTAVNTSCLGKGEYMIQYVIMETLKKILVSSRTHLFIIGGGIKLGKETTFIACQRSKDLAPEVQFIKDF